MTIQPVKDEPGAFKMPDGQILRIMSHTPRIFRVKIGEEISPPEHHEWIIIAAMALPGRFYKTDGCYQGDVFIRIGQCNVYRAPLVAMMDHWGRLKYLEGDGATTVYDSAEAIEKASLALFDVAPDHDGEEVLLLNNIAGALENATSAWHQYVAAVGTGGFFLQDSVAKSVNQNVISVDYEKKDVYVDEEIIVELFVIDVCPSMPAKKKES